MDQHIVKVADPGHERPVALVRISPTGFVRWAFWGLRLYIVVMLVLVVIGFSRGFV